MRAGLGDFAQRRVNRAYLEGNMAKPRVFLGSASETRKIIDALEAELRDVAKIERWDVDVFRPGHFTLDELTTAVRQVDFAIFVLGREDTTETRGRVVASPRDNVIFEAGLFTAVLGRERTFFVVDKAGTKIPSDWAGLGYTTFDDAEDRPRDKVYDAVRKIRAQISSWQPLKSLGPIADIVGPWWQFVINVDVGAVLSFMEISAAGQETPVLNGTSWSDDGSELARYRSQAARYDEHECTLYYWWEGRHPREQAIPRFFGVGEITFQAGADAVLTSADGWFSASSSLDVTDALAKSAVYARATSDEVATLQSGDRSARTELIRAKLTERQHLKS